MCAHHWAMVPDLLRNEVLRQWRAGNIKSVDYLNPKIKAVEIVHRKERPELYEDFQGD